MKNFILKTITFIAFMAWLLTACAFDSEMFLPQIVVINMISAAWIVSHFYINRFYYWREFNKECL